MWRGFIVFLFFGCASYPANKTKIQSSDRLTVLSHFNKILNTDIPAYGRFVDGGFSNTSDGATVGYTVFDLSDTLNVNKLFPGDSHRGIGFLDGHFFHFSPAITHMSFSYIVYFEEGEMILFRKINCPDHGDSFDSVIDFARRKLKGKPSEKMVLQNIMNYRKYGVYFAEDVHSATLKCF